MQKIPFLSTRSLNNIQTNLTPSKITDETQYSTDLNSEIESHVLETPNDQLRRINRED